MPCYRIYFSCTDSHPAQVAETASRRHRGHNSQQEKHSEVHRPAGTSGACNQTARGSYVGSVGWQRTAMGVYRHHGPGSAASHHKGTPVLPDAERGTARRPRMWKSGAREVPRVLDRGLLSRNREHPSRGGRHWIRGCVARRLSTRREGQGDRRTARTAFLRYSVVTRGTRLSCREETARRAFRSFTSPHQSLVGRSPDGEPSPCTLP